MMPLNHIFVKCTGGYKLHKPQEKINHQMYMDIKFFSKKRKRIGNPNTASKEIGMEFGIEKRAALIMKSDKR